MIAAHSLPLREPRWKSFLEKNIGWIVVAGSIWLTHFLR